MIVGCLLETCPTNKYESKAVQVNSSNRVKGSISLQLDFEHKKKGSGSCEISSLAIIKSTTTDS
jgi:hypothetical protein